MHLSLRSAFFAPRTCTVWKASRSKPCPDFQSKSRSRSPKTFSLRVVVSSLRWSPRVSLCRALQFSEVTWEIRWLRALTYSPKRQMGETKILTDLTRQKLFLCLHALPLSDSPPTQMWKVPCSPTHTPLHQMNTRMRISCSRGSAGGVYVPLSCHFPRACSL